MDGNSAISYLTGPDWRLSRLGLSRMHALLARLGDPHKQLKYVHVAGTNGKGSVCALSASILSAAGYKTGLYTSPYINRFHERVQTGGVPIGDAALAELTRRVRREAEQLEDHPTEFELITALGFLYFAQEGCDIVVLEVGLGGRLDATNVIPPPEVAVITPISLDHTRELGDTVEKIAAEKAGIIKRGCRVVSSPQAPGVAEVLREVCATQGVLIGFLEPGDVRILHRDIEGTRFAYKGRENLEISLLGTFQPQNAAVVLEVMDVLGALGWNIPPNALQRGLAQARWPARFEVLQREPWFIVDGGHNPQCVDALMDNLSTYFPGKKVTFITGVMADKDFEAMFGKIIPVAKRIFTVTPANPRALSAQALADYFLARGVVEVIPCKGVEQGVREALAREEKEGVICAFGSFYMAGTIRAMLGAK